MAIKIEDKELRAFIDKQFDNIGLDEETKEVFVDTLHAYNEHQIDALRYSSQLWPDRDNLPTGDPIGDVEELKYKVNGSIIGPDTYIGFDYPKDESYYTVIRQAGAHIDHGDCVQPFNHTKCCNNKENHKKVPVFSSIITVCAICDSKIKV